MTVETPVETAVTNGDSSYLTEKKPIVDKKNNKIPKRKRNKKKKRVQVDDKKHENNLAENTQDDVIIEYVPQKIEIDDPNFKEFAEIFSHFQGLTNDEGDANDADDLDGEKIQEKNKGDNDSEEEEDSDSDVEKDKSKLSKKKLRKINRLSVAELKQLVKKPEVVEWVDVTAADPKLLVYLKAYRNSVTVPKHWSQKRKYLQGKRGIEKPPFELPEFIKDTGIMEMRSAVKEKEDAAKLKSKTRERVQPKMGKLDIDYQKLHDAFFRFQTKPRLTTHGELYYEGKEFETKLKEKKPGQLSEELKAALNIPPLAPPPWLINMQRYGPPPSYPNLKIPGLNAPIPEGAQWGYHPGGWGKPPVDEFNRPLYGDVFGTTTTIDVPFDIIEPVEKTPWGELDSDDEEEEEEEEEDDDEEMKEDEAETESVDLREGLETPSGLSSVQTGLETPAYIELRKNVERELEDDQPKQLYHVIQQKDTAVSGFMGSQHVYDMSSGASGSSGRSKRKTGAGIDVAIDPSEINDQDVLRAKYEEKTAALPENSREDFSDMVAEHANKQAKKRQKTTDSKKDSSKKLKDFKF
ncbi:hypothetical protein K7432_002327 [Basidiobolus ranarum]|uniref:PSP proline-rich domain-containing protein n=1 Tax=Basidiobolus ranarum TaxID=34480 RepID=A0ABR2X1S3_9FUNG